MANDEEVRRSLLELGSATLGETGGRAMHPRVKAAWPGAHVAAPAVPVTCAPGDNLAIHVAVARASEGSVLVADTGDVNNRGYWGEVLTTGAESRGLRGLVIDGCVRDVDALEAPVPGLLGGDRAERGDQELTRERRVSLDGRRSARVIRRLDRR